ncbi:TIGR02444 family protein [Rhodobium gokarnense]|uniref:Uncharacterized protein (TIGR02444 family) n=1 Tax=Rhodobium gokarnense TaxID=364296 RepID=A0ABT3HBD3_9HYPH|nr:TIGR02444 family protein [Rhodobium gokarnense]MCW2307702.1 uncharacterized protein (TIGR02444 family) [Rhodobium gokarnense]
MTGQEQTPADGPEGALWAFALAVYGRRGVAEACLCLQDRCGADVPLMLAVLFAAGRGMAPDRGRMERLDTLCRDWRSEVVMPLRKARRWIKGRDWMETHAAVPALRDGIKALELEAERIELMALEAEVASWGEPARAPATTDYRNVLAEFLRFCEAGSGSDAEGADVEKAVATIVEAVRKETL